MIALSDGVTIAVVVFAGSLAATVSPLVLAWITNRAYVQRRQQEWTRQDQVEERAAHTAADILAAQRLVVAGVDTANAKLVEVSEVTHVTHALVNSDKTSRMIRERESMIKALALAKELADLRATLGQTIRADLIAQMARDQAEIDTLGREIDDRLAQQHAAEEQTKGAAP